MELEPLLDENGEVVGAGTPLPAPPADNTSVMQEMMRTLQRMESRMDGLAKENEILKQAVAVSAEEKYSQPGHLVTDKAGIPHNPDAARSVTIATRPVRDTPEQYTGIVDPGGLSINGASPMSGKNR